jgi:predicted ATPase/transcriptional regulator with XRE-family HTH domain
MDTIDSFGYWVRRRRKSLDLTQEELAQRVSCAVVTLRKIEADERHPSQQLAERLAAGLALPTADRPLFLAAAAAHRAAAHLPPFAANHLPRPLTNLPAPVTSTVGRATATAALLDDLGRRRVRLLTLTGPVGVGKTRLALEAGRQLLASFGDGVWLVALASVHDPDMVAAAAAAALGAREARGRDLTQTLSDYLAPRQMLLIFDNFEHLLPAAPLLSRLLAAAPAVQILVTSRARLHLYGEHEFVVPPLALAAADDPALATSPAVQLFCQRAQAARAGFHLTPAMAPVVADLCRRLDGLPLAIELAAARVRTLSPTELQGRLEQRLPLLIQDAADLPSHGQGLTEAIAWSYDLLPPAEQTLLNRLAVFSGGFSLPAAEAVCAAATLPDIAAGLGVLLDHSLAAPAEGVAAIALAVAGRCGSCPLRQLQDVSATESRFALLETIRAFAWERLQTCGELAEMQRRHAHYYAAWAGEAAAQLHGPQQAFCLTRLEQEADNLRAALAWLLAAEETATAASMACALGPFWQRHGHYSEGRRWLEQVLAQLPPDRTPPTLRAHTLQTIAALAYRQGDYATARTWLAESLALYQGAGHLAGMARSLFDLGWIALDQADWPAAARLNQESLHLARAIGDACAIYQALTNLGWARLAAEGWEEAAALFSEARAVAGSIGHSKGEAVSLANLGWVALHRQDAAAAADLAGQSLRLCYLLGEQEVLAECLEILAAAAAARGEAGRGVTLHAAAATLWQRLHVTPVPAPVRAERGLAALRQQLAAAEFAAAWQQGQSLRLEALVALALACDAPSRGAVATTA